MAKRLDNELGFSFANVQIFRDQKLGHGSYGAVYKAKCDSLPCAAKLIHPRRFSTNLQAPKKVSLPDKEHGQRIEAECRFLSHIKHPNIVQYLGVYRDPKTNIPMLLLELMDESLTHFLEKSQITVLYHLQVNILHDTALALAFLHSNGITHQHMSSNNVLLIAGSRAKVTDFGMSTLTHVTASQHASLIQSLGTPDYMSPEALEEPPVYSEKMDCFSFGVLTIQVITRQSPKPMNRFQTMSLPHPTEPSRRHQALIHIPEEKRRQSHISLIPATHPLRQIALSCIKDKDTERPTAEELCQTLEQLKSTQVYASSVQQVRERECQIRTQRQTIKEKDEQIQNNLQKIQEKERQLQSTQQEIQLLQQMLELKNRQVIELQQGTAQHEEAKTHPSKIQPQLQQQALTEKQTEAKKKPELPLKWRMGPRAPSRVIRGSSAIIGNIVHVNSYGDRNIYSFNYSTSTWSTSLKCPYPRSTLTSIKNTLTTVGGVSTNKLFTYRDHKWMRPYPPMPTARQSATVVSTTTYVAVIGGNDGSDQRMDCVEVLDIADRQWSTAAQLPFRTYRASATLCGDTIYLMGGDTPYGSNNAYSVLSCQFSELIQSSRHSKQTQPSPSTVSTPSKVWHHHSDLPVSYSACVTVHGKVLAIGGRLRDTQRKYTTSIYKLNMETKEWCHSSDVNIGRSECLATTLPDYHLLVVGGYIGDNCTDETEIATTS